MRDPRHPETQLGPTDTHTAYVKMSSQQSLLDCWNLAYSNLASNPKALNYDNNYDTNNNSDYKIFTGDIIFDLELEKAHPSAWFRRESVVVSGGQWVGVYH